MTSAATELRAAVITRLKADTGVRATALGASPRIYNRAPDAGDEGSTFPFLIIDQEMRAWDTDTDRGAEFELLIYVEGEYEGDKQGEDIFDAVRRCLRDWAPAALSTHRLVNLIWKFEDVRAEEGGRRYFGLQRWRAVTEETS